jgi:hypothetical protein
VDYTQERWYAGNKRLQKDADQGLVTNEKTGENIAVTYKAENAYLVAAAPELLTALTALESQAHYMDNMQHSGLALYPMDWSKINDLCSQARDAIAKATGE